MLQKLSKLFQVTFKIVAILLVIGLWSTASYLAIWTVLDETEGEDCNVYGINIHGDIVTYHSNEAYNDSGSLVWDQTSADDVIFSVQNAEADEAVKAIIVEIDSAGGSLVGGEEMMLALKQAKKPVVAFIRDLGASSGYLASVGADTIFASKFSDVGSIGVTMSYLQETEKNTKDGLTYIDLSSGKFKDSGSPNRELSAEEKEIFMRDVKINHEHFVNLVAENRKLDLAKVRKLADGSTLTGESAKKEGLIDEIGTYSDVKEFLAKKLGEPVSVCWQN